MNNQKIVKLLRNIAAAYTIKDEKKHRFQIIAYQKAADLIHSLTDELKDLYKENKLKTIPGIGSSISSHLEELLKNGKVVYFNEVLRDIPDAVFPLLDVPSFGPKKAFKLVEAFKLKDAKKVIDDVKRLAKENKISKLPGFGEKSEQDILQAINEYKQGKTKTNRMPLPFAFELAEKVVNYLKESKDVIEANPLGSLRRMASTIGDIDIAVSTDNPQSVINHFTCYPNKERVIEKGNATASIILNGGKQVDLMVQKPESFGSLLQHFTGSKNHNIKLREYALKKGLSLSEYGIKHKMENGKWKMETFDSEEKFYQALSLDWIPPEIREDQGEIELANKHQLPNLVDLKDIKGDLHLHSDFPIEPSHDLGINSMQDLIKKAESLNYEYVAFSEHNPSISRHKSSDIYSILSRRKEKIEQIKENNKSIQIINMLEVDILSDGKLPLDDKSIGLLDAFIVGIHGSFAMDEKTMTKRILQGFSHPKAKVLAHPTGRMVNERPGYSADWEKIFDFVKKNNKALEINSWPSRLDLPDSLVKNARELGVKFVIDTDSHALHQMDNMFYGVSVARRGWCTKEDVLNTLPYEEFIKWLKE